jgi:hypothetical protein
VSEKRAGMLDVPAVAGAPGGDTETRKGHRGSFAGHPLCSGPGGSGDPETDTGADTGPSIFGQQLRIPARTGSTTSGGGCPTDRNVRKRIRGGY